MNCSDARDIFPVLLDRRTAANAQLEARTHLAGCPDCQREFSALSQTLAALDTMPTSSPSPRLRQNFYAMLEEEKHAAVSRGGATAAREPRPARVALWRWFLSPVAGATLLLFGFLAGARYAPAPAVAAPATDPATQRELAALRTKVDTMSQLVGYSFLQQQTQRPANDRLRGVLTSARLENPNQQILNYLIGALALDPSTNVRLCAVEALYPHADQEIVRAGVLASLPREQSPLVQLAMIDFLAAARDHEAAPALEKISQTETADGSVRAAARRALVQL